MYVLRTLSHATRQQMTKYDAIVVGGGHNGLVTAAYLASGSATATATASASASARAGLRVLVLERRPVLGGAAVTEEIVPGFKFSRASYLLSLLRPAVVQQLDLARHGLRTHLRTTSSFTPSLARGGSPLPPLVMGRDRAATLKSIAAHSQRDADAFEAYEAALDRYVNTVDVLLDRAPVNVNGGALLDTLGTLAAVARRTRASDVVPLYELLTAPAAKVLDRWFESKVLKATLATDAVIGAFTSPYMPGSGYVLLHHVMGQVDGVKGAWAYAQGGMGAVSDAIAGAARERGAELVTGQTVTRILVEDGRATGVQLEDGTRIEAGVVLSNATPKVTFEDLVGMDLLPGPFARDVRAINYQAATMKINVAVNELPNFKAIPNVPGSGVPQPHHQATAHFEESMEEIHRAYLDAMEGRPSERPLIEMCVPSALDPTLAPPGKHVVSLFVQYTPYHLKNGASWEDPSYKERYADKVFSIIDRYAPNFSASVIGRDVLSPLDLERIFGLTGGNIFHGAMSLDQLYFARPTPSASRYATPIKGLYLCGSGTHPGGGVMGAAGRNAAMQVLADLGKAGGRFSKH